MRPLKSTLMAATAVLAFAMAATPVLAQTPPAETPPAQTPPTQTPPTQTPPPAQTPPQTPPQRPPSVQTPPQPAPAPQPPRPFPQGAKIAFVNIQSIAQGSAAGKDATKKLADLQSKKVQEIGDKNKQLQALTTKRDQGGAVLNDTARAQLDKDIEKLQRDIQFSQTNAQAEMQDLQNELQTEFQKKLMPILDVVASEKGLQAVFSVLESGVAWFDPGLDISEEVVKRLDAARPAVPAKK